MKKIIFSIFCIVFVANNCFGWSFKWPLHRPGWRNPLKFGDDIHRKDFVTLEQYKQMFSARYQIIRENIDNRNWIKALWWVSGWTHYFHQNLYSHFKKSHFE